MKKRNYISFIAFYSRELGDLKFDDNLMKEIYADYVYHMHKGILEDEYDIVSTIIAVMRIDEYDANRFSFADLN